MIWLRRMTDVVRLCSKVRLMIMNCVSMNDNFQSGQIYKIDQFPWRVKVQVKLIYCIFFLKVQTLHNPVRQKSSEWKLRMITLAAKLLSRHGDTLNYQNVLSIYCFFHKRYTLFFKKNNWPLSKVTANSTRFTSEDLMKTKLLII